MFPCHACHRHIRERQGGCPFCGASIREDSSPLRELVGVLIVGASLLGSVACGPGRAEQDNTSSSPTTSSETTSTTGAATATDSETTMGAETETDTGDETDGPTDTSGSFYAGPDPDLPPSPQDCDLFTQDCPEGEKCVPYGGWSELECVPVLGDGQPGEPCIYQDNGMGLDDCDETSLCFNVQDVEGEKVGTCAAFCQAEDPQCAEGTACLQGGDVYNYCVDQCDPLMQACPEDTACYWNDADFICIFVTQDIPEGEPCGYWNDCATGLDCTPADIFGECEAADCCAAYCDITDPEACPAVDRTCVPFFEAPAPEGFEAVGLCVKPPP